MGEPAPSRFERRAFVVLFAVAAFLFFWTLSPLWAPVFLGVLVAIVTKPLQRRLERRFVRHPRLVAAAITSVTIGIGLGILGLVSFVVLREVLRLLEVASGQIASGELLRSPGIARLLARFGETPTRAREELHGYAGTLVASVTSALGTLLRLTTHGLLALFFTTITSYYLLVDGELLSGFFVRLIPLPLRHTQALMREFREVSVVILLSVGVLSLLQGIVAGVGFALFSVPSATAWGALTAVASLVPTVGTALVCIPVAIVQMALGHHVSGLCIIAWWAVMVVGIPDYVIRPRLVSGHMHVHSLLVFIALFGGIEAFGPVGLLLGPLFVALFVTILRLYDRTYRPAIVGATDLG
jgi:predicted PurR-regulated permease PerM